MAPGDSETGQVTVSNDGSLEYRYAITSTTTEDVLAVPHAGRILATMTGQHGELLILGLPALVLAIGQLRALVASARAVSARTASAGNHRSGVVAATVTILAVATFTGATLVQTMATFTDANPAGDNTFSTGTFGSA